MGKTILIADDDKDLVYKLRFMLKQEGFNVIGFTDSYLLYDTIRLVKPDLILLDRMLGNADGREICRYIKESELDTNVILISQLRELGDVLRFSGAPDDFIENPLDRSELISKVKYRLAA